MRPIYIEHYYKGYVTDNGTITAVNTILFDIEHNVLTKAGV